MLCFGKYAYPNIEEEFGLSYIIIWLAIFIVFESVCLFIYRESSGFTVTNYEIKVDKYLPKPLNIVMLSDLHDTDLGNDNEDLLKKIDEINPDFVLLAGDMITSYMQPSYNSKVTLSFLRRLAAKHVVYYGLGNHEQRYYVEPNKFKGKYEELKKFVEDVGITLLNDQKIDISEVNTSIYGFSIPIEYYRRVVTKKLPSDLIYSALGDIDNSRVNILMAHTPDQFDAYAEWGADVVVSGHIHGGIVGIPKLGGLISPQLKLFPKYDFGMFVKDKTTMILGRGIGWHTVPVRIFNKAEIVRLTIVGSSVQ